MKQKKYYALCAADGVGIFDSWDLVLICRGTLKRSNAHAFSTEEEASNYAYDHLNEIAPLGVRFPTQLKLNKVVRVNQLRAIR